MLESKSVTIADRQAIWEVAKELVDPIVNEHGLEGYIYCDLTTTKVDQHIEHVIRVADWLLE